MKNAIIKNSDIEKIYATSRDSGINAFQYLCACRDLATWLSFELKKLKPLLIPLFQAFDAQKGELIEKYGDRDEEGKLIQPGQNVFRFTEKAMEFKAEYDKFMEFESEVLFKRLLIILTKDVPDKYLSADDIEALECLVDFRMPEEREREK